jgi:hypothetical protein
MVPFYLIADYLNLSDLLPGTYQPPAPQQQEVCRSSPSNSRCGPLRSCPLGKAFIKDFLRVRQAAYSVPAQRTQADIGEGGPGGLRSLSVEGFEFLRYRSVDGTLSSLTIAAPATTCQRDELPSG